MPLDPNRIQTAVAHHQSGRWRDAELIYRQLLAEDPNHPDLWHLLGVLAYQVGRPAMAVDYIRRAIGLYDRAAAYFGNLGEAYRVQNDMLRAEKAFRRAIELDPNLADAHGNLALLLQATGRLDEARAAADRTVELRPQHAESHNNRGLILQQSGDLAAARQAFVTAAKLRSDFLAPRQNLEQLATTLRQQKRTAEVVDTFAAIVELQPNSPHAWSNYAAVLVEANRPDEAQRACERAVQIDPQCIDAWNNWGSLHLHQGRFAEAERCLQRALEIQPDALDALVNLATLQMRTGHDDRAESTLQQVLKRRPDLESARVALAQLWLRQGRTVEANTALDGVKQAKLKQFGELMDQGVNLLHRGQPDAAGQAFERALQIEPNHAACHSNNLFSQLYLPESTPERLLELHREFDRRHVLPLRSQVREPAVPRDPHRVLRLGFVSADLRHHPIGFLLLRLLEGLDRTQFTPIAYSNRASKCETQQRLRQSVALWRDIELLDDGALAEQVRADQIDILFDLSGHTSGNRLLTFARRPAPVQVTWLAYPNTTGVSAIDYLLTDQRMTPRGAERWYVEKVVRLPEVGAVYFPPQSLPAIGPLPAVSPQSITFGSFNNPAKLNRRVVRLWSDVLERLPLARLVLKFRGLDEPSAQERFADWFADAGVSRRRIEFLGDTPIDEMLAEYNRIDIALDTFPYSGGTTTMLALLMGVPVVTLPGETMASRQSLSVLGAIGADELIATDAEDYVDRVVALAYDLPRLAELRRGLRGRMLQSPFCDAARFADQFAITIRRLWQGDFADEFTSSRG